MLGPQVDEPVHFGAVGDRGPDHGLIVGRGGLTDEEALRLDGQQGGQDPEQHPDGDARGVVARVAGEDREPEAERAARTRPTRPPKSSSSTTGSSGALAVRMNRHQLWSPRTWLAARVAVRSETLSSPNTTARTTNPTAALSTGRRSRASSPPRTRRTPSRGRRARAPPRTRRSTAPARSRTGARTSPPVASPTRRPRGSSRSPNPRPSGWPRRARRGRSGQREHPDENHDGDSEVRHEGGQHRAPASLLHRRRLPGGSTAHTAVVGTRRATSPGPHDDHDRAARAPRGRR